MSPRVGVAVDHVGGRDAGADRHEPDTIDPLTSTETGLGDRARTHVMPERGREPDAVTDEIAEGHVAKTHVRGPSGDAVDLVDHAGRHDADRDRSKIGGSGGVGQRGGDAHDGVDDRVRPALGTGWMAFDVANRLVRVDERALDAGPADVDRDHDVIHARCLLLPHRGHIPRTLLDELPDVSRMIVHTSLSFGARGVTWIATRGGTPCSNC